MKNKNINIPEELLVKYLTKSTDLKENLEVEKWLTESSENKHYLELFQKVWQLSENAKNVENIENFDTEIALKKVKSKINQQNTVQPKSKIRKMMPYFAIAASILIIVAVFYIMRVKNNNKTDNLQQIVIETISNEKKEVVLPDKSIVYLNENSKIIYTEHFIGDFRNIEFSGEAYFVITPDKSKPFKISTKQSFVQVVGTEFNLRAIENEEIESIIVSEGKVILEDSKNEFNNVELSVGERGTFNKSDNSISKEINSDENFMAWKTGILMFTDKSLNDVAERLSLFYKVKFEFQNQEIENLKLTAKYDNLEISEIIDILQLSLEIKIEKSDNKYIIRKVE